MSNNRYHATLMRTAVIGQPPAKWEECAKVIIDGLNGTDQSYVGKKSD